MNFIFRNLVPYKMILKYFIGRFLGKYCYIDLDRADFSRDEVVFRDLELDCDVSSTKFEDITDT